MTAARAAWIRSHANLQRLDLTAREQYQGGRARKPPALGAFLGACLALWSTVITAATPPGTLINNTAQVDYLQGATPSVSRSNDVSVVVQATTTPSSVSILRYSPGAATSVASIGPTLCRSGASYSTLPAPALLNGTLLNPSQATPLDATNTVHGGEPIFLQLVDPDQNRDPTVRDTIDLRVTSASGDAEFLRLTETGVDTGAFAGYIATSTTTAVPGDCVLQVVRNETLGVNYTDPLTPSDTSSATALVDPYGLVFDSSTGVPVDGVRIRLVNLQTGQDALVLGDDGVSRYPATIVTGSPATDSGGTTYTLPAGVFRFPLVTPGNYQLQLQPPAGYAFPSAVSAAALQLLAGAPYRIGDGSYGKPFSTATPPAVTALDVPLDPTGTRLYLQKATTTTTAAIGDFVPFTLTVQNAAGNGPFRSVTVSDQLPSGLRFRAGTVRFNNRVAPDPKISPDGRQLTFTTGQIDAGAQLLIQYVTEVVAGAHGTKLSNTAMAVAREGVTSNAATATFLLREELFRDAGIVMGRVVQARCDQDTHTVPGVAGIRIYLEDGRYALTDAEGKFHFEGVPPAAHVVQLDTATLPPELEVSSCDSETRHAGRGYSQFVELRSGMLWRADFRLINRPPPLGTADLELSSAADGTNGLTHTLVLRSGSVPLQGLRLRLLVPEGLRYLEGSARFNGQSAAAPQADAGVLSFQVGALPANASATLTLRTVLAPGPAGGLSVRAFATFATPGQLQLNTAPVSNTVHRSAARSESANYRFTPHFDVLAAGLKDGDRARLDAIAAQWRGVRNLAITVVGHTDSQPIAAANRGRYADNYALAQARAASVAEYLRNLLGADSAAIQTTGKGPDEPLQTGQDAASLAANRRVEIAISGERQLAVETLAVLVPEERSAALATVGSWRRTAPGNPLPLPATSPDTNAGVDIEALSSSAAWVLPAADFQAAIPSIKIAISHAPGQTVELTVNGRPASALDFDGVTRNLAGTVALSRWRGVDLIEGENKLTAVIRTADGHEFARLARSVHFGDGAVHSELVRERSVLAADGTTRPVIALRMVDRYGKPARNGTVGGFSVDAPYRSWFEVQTLHDNELLSVGRRDPVFEVGRDGIALIELEPTAQAGTAVLHLRYSDRHSEEIHVWLEPQARDWVLVGIAAGTVAYDSIAGNLQAASDAGLAEGYSKDGRVAFFAKGAIRGKYLLTAAYDSARVRDTTQARLLSVIEPDRYYTIYGDATEQRFEAPSAEKLYLKIERGQFYAMFGDYQTGLTVTELSRYSRVFTGVKAEYAGDRYSFLGFATNSDQDYVHDELPGDGTSGLYHLSRRDLVINSDRIRIEARDRIRTEQVVATRTLSRYLDYSIDYQSGTVFFRQPVAGRDENFNPQIIVAEYETAGTKKSVTAGGRAAVKSHDNQLEVGATLVEQGADVGRTLLGGVDLRWNASESTRVRAEVAHTDSKDPARRPQASAYLAEVQHVTDKVDARAYLREQQPGFGVNQQLSVDAGARRLGADGRLKLAKYWSVRGEAYREDVLDAPASRQLASAEVRREDATHTLDAGIRHVADQPVSGSSKLSDQAFLGGSVDLLQARLRLRASQEFAVSGHDASADFPTRTLLGTDYRWSRDTTFFTDYEHSSGAAIRTDTTRLGVRSMPWEHAQLQSSLGQQFTEHGPRLFSTLGLTQGWQPDEHWTFDFGLDQTRTLRGATLQPVNPRVPLASGTLGDDYVATFAGALYRTPLWTFTSRLEHRNATSEERWVATGGFYREPLRGHAFSLAANLLDSSAKTGTGTDSRTENVRLSWAFRPISSRWIVLDRLDLRFEQSGRAATELKSARVVDNFNSSWQIDPRSQLGLQLALRYSEATISGDRYSGVASLIGFDYRQDLRPRVDCGVHGTRLQSWSAHVADSSFGFDVGFVPARNVWISIGYNFKGYADRDFDANRYSAAGPFIAFRIKADQDTFKDLSLASLRPQHIQPPQASAPATP